MKSIKQYKESKSNSTLSGILGQSLWYARCCVLSVSFMSGFGLPWNYDDARFNMWFDILHNDENKYEIPENVTILRSIYKKGDPHYSNTYNGNDKDYRNFMWDDSSFKKIITPAAQAYLIMDEIMLAKYFHKCMDDEYKISENHSEKLTTSLLLINSAIVQVQFASDYLRNSDGLFVSKTDLSQNSYGDPYLEEVDGLPTVSDQALVLKALSMLSDSLMDDKLPLFKDNSDALSVKKYADEIFQVFLDSPDEIFNSKTRDLCNVISSSIQYYALSQNKDAVFDYITRLALELESRVDMSGNLTRFPFENKLTSNSSCFTAIKALMEAYKFTGIYKFLNTSITLYKKLNLLWDPVNNLYLLDNEDKYKYTLRDIGSVISGLNALRLFANDDYKNDAGSKLLRFFNSAVNSSKLVQSSMPPPPDRDFESFFNCLRSGSESVAYGDFCNVDIPQALESGIAPVFAKKFTFSPKKRKFDINSCSFYSEYALFTASEMLQMNYPEIQCFYEATSCPLNNNEDTDSGGLLQDEGSEN